MAGTLKMVMWNANGIMAKKSELQVFATDHDADVILLSETHLQQRHNFRLPAYTTYRSDRPPNPLNNFPSGGTAVLVHRRITHRLATIPTVTMETTGIAIQFGDTEVTIHSAYLAPSRPFNPGEMDDLLAPNGPILVGGDLNSKHPSWNSRRITTKGRALRRYIDSRDDTIVAGPTDPTHYPNNLGNPDVLDILIAKDFTFEYELTTINDLSSDHVPVIVTISSQPTTRLPPQSTLRTDWTRYYNNLLTQLTPPPPATTPNELDDQVAQLHDKLTTALSNATSQGRPKNSRHSLPDHIKSELALKRRLRRTWQHTHYREDKRAFNRQCQLVKLLLDDYRTETWDTFLTSLDIHDGSAWKVAKALRSVKSTVHPLHGQQGIVYSAQDKAEAFAVTMEQQFEPHATIFNPDFEEEVEQEVQSFLQDTPEGEELHPFTLEEISEVIAMAKSRKAPGEDRIGAKALQASPPELLPHLHSIFNSVLRLRHFPATWKIAKIVLLQKPGKSPLFPQNYRPISLLPTLSKLFERLLLSRLSTYITDYIRPEQFGFRPGHSTTLQLIRVLNHLADAANRGHVTVAVLLDVSKAFDKVWHDGLTFKLKQSPLPPSAVTLLHSYLTGRSFKVCVEGLLSNPRPIQAGVPQGSVLGPLLYLLYTNDIPTTHDSTLFLYADDAMFTCSSLSPALAASKLQRNMTILAPWLEKWRIAVNTDKSDAIVFKKFRKMPRAPPPMVTLNGQPIDYKPHVKYLGVTIDSGLTFTEHTKRKTAEGRKVKGFLQPLISARSPVPLRARVTIFLAIVRSIVIYASAAWWAFTSPTNKKTLEAVQNKALRMITRQPWFVKNNVIRRSLGVPTLNDFSVKTARKLFASAEQSPYAHIRDLSAREGVHEWHRPRPRAILDDPP